jgi:hypothetical protein
MRYLEPATYAALLLAALLACGNGPSPSDKSSPSKGADSTPAESSIAVDATTLIADYKANEVRGDAKWKGKLVRVTGIVGDIKKDFTDSAYVTVGTGAEFEPDVWCNLKPGQEGGAAALSKGARATFKGRVNGLLITSVQLADCELSGGGARPASAPAHAAPTPPAKPHKR